MDDEHRLADDFVAQQKLAEKRGIRTILRYAAIFAGVVLVGALTGIFTKSTPGTIGTMVVLGAVVWLLNAGPSRPARNQAVYLGQLNQKPTDYRALIVRPPDEGAYRSAAPPPDEEAGAEGKPPITRWTD